MVVMCPKCKARLKVDETKLPPAGSRFKCPKCNTVLTVKKPAAQVNKAHGLNGNTVLIAHSNREVLENSASLLSDKGFKVITAVDGIDAMIKALKEHPSLALLEVSLPKIYGFEVCKKIKSRADTKEMKVILIASVYDRKKYKREPNSLYGADEYVEEPELSSQLMEKINLLGTSTKDQTPQKTLTDAARMPDYVQDPPQTAVQTLVKGPGPASSTLPSADEILEKAKRLARTIVNDIYLYNPAKVDASIKDNTFYSVFASDLQEGQKLYDNRIPKEIRETGDYYREAIDNFLSSRKKILV